MGKIAVALIAFSFILTSCSVGSLMGGWNEIVAKTNANYVDYSTEAVKSTNWDKVLFFHATWCGSCKSASKKIAEAQTTTWLTVFKVDYDSNTELRKMYDVTSQHTFVQVDKGWKMLAKWSGSKNIEGIQSNLVESIEKEVMEKPKMMEDNKSDMMTSKKEQVLELAHKMEKDAMNDVKTIYTDLAFVKNISKDDNLNLTAMSEEEWLYSAEYDVTVVTCKALNTPAYVFDGDMISDTELATVKAEMKEMMEMMTEEDKKMMDEQMDDSKMMDKETMSDLKDDMMEEKEVMMKKEWMFVEYSAEKVAATSGNKVLFFHANWCPSCIGAAKNLSAATAPEGLNVFKVDYDSSADLKTKYGVVSQHTFVEIDENGTMVKRWFGSRNYEDILTQLQS